MKRTYGAINHGFESILVNVECSQNNGLPTTTIVGLANKAVDESKERIRAAFSANGLTYPKKKLIINLAPANIPKQDSGLDLSLAIAILNSNASQELLKQDSLFIGELSLDGSIQKSNGIIGKLMAAIDAGIQEAFIPTANSKEAAMVKGIQVYPVDSLKKAIDHLTGISAILPLSEIKLTRHYKSDASALDEIRGQENAKRALLIAVTGGHNLHFYGPPGSGKTMLAKSALSIMPDLSEEEALTVTHLSSLADNHQPNPSLQPPFRSPHHTASSVSIIGGGPNAHPGEVSLAHKGILMLDELPEYDRHTLETLRQPLEDKVIVVSRAKVSTTYPADFLLIATSNPCPCGYLESSRPCTCTTVDISRYKKKLSGPIMDRIDMHTYVSSVDPSKILDNGAHSPTLSAKDYHAASGLARKKQMERNPDSKLNGNLSAKDLRAVSNIDPDAKELLEKAVEKLGLTNRGYIKTARIARTIADLDGSNSVKKAHMAEAIQYRKRSSS